MKCKYSEINNHALFSVGNIIAECFCKLYLNHHHYHHHWSLLQRGGPWQGGEFNKGVGPLWWPLQDNSLTKAFPYHVNSKPLSFVLWESKWNRDTHSQFPGLRDEWYLVKTVPPLKIPSHKSRSFKAHQIIPVTRVYYFTKQFFVKCWSLVCKSL